MAERISLRGGKLEVPDHPTIPYIEGDGTGPDIWRASRPVFDAAVRVSSRGKRSIVWKEVLAGEAAYRKVGTWLPEETLEAFREYVVGIKGPLTTPVGEGIRSLNVTLRQELDLYACIRPVYYIPGVPAPVRNPGALDIVIFRENTEDVYAGVEFAPGSAESLKLREFLVQELGIPPAKIAQKDVGIGIKPVSKERSKRLVRKAIRYALEKGRPSVTLVHKGNIMKYTEGAFREWGYEVAREEFSGVCLTREEVDRDFGGNPPKGKIVIQDVIADNMFQQLLTRTSSYSVLATTNLNGDYLSDAAAGQVGGLGIAPGGNVGDGYAIFEATHGTAPKYAGQDKVNPGSLLLSGSLMFEYLGWDDAAWLVRRGYEEAVRRGIVTYDFARELGLPPSRTSEVGRAIVEWIEKEGASALPRA